MEKQKWARPIDKNTKISIKLTSHGKKTLELRILRITIFKIKILDIKLELNRGTDNIQSNPMTYDGSRPKASMSVSEKNYIL